MRLPELEKLHDETIQKLKLMKDGYGPSGLAALVDVAKMAVICDIANAIRRDLAKL